MNDKNKRHRSLEQREEKRKGEQPRQDKPNVHPRKDRNGGPAEQRPPRGRAFEESRK
jgi:hypothetical protein